MWMPARLTVPPARTRRSATGTSSPAGANTTARSHGVGRQLGRRRRPTSRPARARARGGARRASCTTDLAPPVLQHLEREVRGRAEAQQRDALAGLHLGPPQRAVPDHARAQQRRGLEVVERRRAAATAKSSGTVTASAYPPSTVHPVNSARSQRFSSPRAAEPAHAARCGAATPHRRGRRARAARTRHRARRRRRPPGDRARRAGAGARDRPRRRAGRCGSTRTRGHAPAPRPARAREPAARPA